VKEEEEEEEGKESVPFVAIYWLLIHQR